MRMLLRILLAGLGAAAVAIALSILFVGPEATLAGGKQAYEDLMGMHPQPSPEWAADMDSELRFYAALWGAYGILLLAAAQNLVARLHWVPWLAGVFLVGGLGRLASYITVGEPHPFLVLLMSIELLVPPILVVLWSRLRVA